ncbi:MAG TPA: glycosyltransferase family 4 protein [Puia sp.]|nr:glycosyltransferase family 4 protein [Puia sp.]
MKIAFISRSTLYSDKGGDTIQILQTAKGLKELGLTVDIFLSNQNIDYAAYDLLHFFNIIRPDDILPHIRLAKTPFVISTIFVDYAEYERQARQGRSSYVFRFLPDHTIEYLKALARFILNGEKIKSSYYLFRGHRRSIQKVAEKASLLLPNSENEYKRLVKAYSIHTPYRVIPNGIDPILFNPQPTTISRNDRLILCVARNEGRKNQLNLIRALNNTRYDLILIGARSTNQMGYYEQCKREAGPNIRFIDFLDQQDLLSYYRQAKVHVLPSWFETTGLSSLEAAAMGCNIVITEKGDAKEYFGDYAWYCDPGSPDSIYQAVDQAATHPVPAALSNLVCTRYTWTMAASRTLQAYQEVIPVVRS